jgi:hypothetical protein
MTRPRPAALLVALLLALGAEARPAEAGREVGRLAPELEGMGAWNTPAVPSPLRSLRGRMVVLEFLRVDCPRCQAAVPALNAMHREGFDAGVRVVGACRQGADRIAAFVRERRVAYPVVRVTSETVEDYDIPGYPEAFVIGTDGRILWSGDPSALDRAAIERLRVATAPWTALAESLPGAAAALRSDDATGARRVLERCRDAADVCSLERATAARGLLAWIDAWAATLDRAATAELARHDPYEAWKALDLLARAFAGAPEGVAARARIEGLLADPAARREVDAGRALAAARRLLVAGDDASAVVALDRIVASHPGTRAAGRAAVVAARHRGRGE